MNALGSRVAPDRPKPPRSGPSYPSKPSKPSIPFKVPVTGERRHEPKLPNTESGPPSLPPRPTPGHLLYRYVCSEPHGIAKVHYDATDDDELSYQEGDVIELIEKVDEHWCFARNADMDMYEGLVLVTNLNIVKRLPGHDIVAGFEDGPCAVAVHNFDATSIDELTFKTGDLIMLKSRVGSDWYRGKTISGSEGIFPKCFVEVVEDLPPCAIEEMLPQVDQEATSCVKEPHCIAMYSFDGERADELSFKQGDTIVLLEKVDAKWMRGRLHGKEGIFPLNFVDIKVDLVSKKDELPASNKDQTSVVTALYDFEGLDGELSFKTGDKIQVTSRISSDWLVGIINGKKGNFPESFVDSVPSSLPQTSHSGEQVKDASFKQQLFGECVALFDFQGDSSAGELSFSAGEVILTTDWINEEWMSGKVGSREGIFPVNFVKVTMELSKKFSTETTVVKKTTQVMDDLMPKAVALFDFTAGSSEEISFKEGDLLYLLDRVGDVWFMGENVRTGDIGTFPANLVNVTNPLP